jgi:hypothetical protein
MKKTIGVLVLAFFSLGLTAQSALADAITITFTGSYSSDSNFSLFSAPDGTFSISFLVPSTFPAGPFATEVVALNTTDDNPASVQPGVVDFLSTGSGGLFDFNVTEEAVTYSWVAKGPQLYTLNSSGTTATLIPNGVFNVVPSASIFSGGSFFSDTNGDLSPIASGVVTLTSSIPEPPAFYLLLCGCLALATLKRKFLPS